MGKTCASLHSMQVAQEKKLVNFQEQQWQQLRVHYWLLIQVQVFKEMDGNEARFENDQILVFIIIVIISVPVWILKYHSLYSSWMYDDKKVIFFCDGEVNMNSVIVEVHSCNQEIKQLNYCVLQSIFTIHTVVLVFISPCLCGFSLHFNRRWVY